MAELNIKKLSYEDLEEAVIQMHRRGELPDIEKLIAAFPYLADEIRQYLPTTLMVDEALSQNNVSIECPKTINGCIVECELGRGAMGVVYRAIQPAFDRTVAVKVIPHHAKKTTRDRFEIERISLARLDHPNIVSAYSFESDQSNSYLMMQYVDGYSLLQLMQNECPAKDRYLLSALQTCQHSFLAFAKEILSGLHHAHDSDIIHRDIKPGNLMLDHTGKAWITDFGLAKSRSAPAGVSKTGDVIGTPLYMAPEQTIGIVDPRSDLYSFGLTLIEILVGREKFLQLKKGTNEIELEQLQQLLPDFPEKLLQIIVKSCHSDPTLRFQTAVEMKTVFERFERGWVPDRRSGPRLPDDVYRRQFRFKSVVTVLTSICLFGGGTAMFFASLNPTAPVAQHQDNFEPNYFLDALVDSSETDSKTAGSKVISESIGKVVRQLDLSESDSKKLQNELKILVKEFETDPEGVSKKIRQTIAHYKNSPPSISTKIARTIPIINRSGLVDKEKANGETWIREYSKFVAKGIVDKQQAEKLVFALTKGANLNRNKISADIQATDYQIRIWLHRVKSQVHEARVKAARQNEISVEQLSKLFLEVINEDSAPASSDSPESNSIPRDSNAKALQELSINKQTD